jgi:hypothetical protein
MGGNIHRRLAGPLRKSVGDGAPTLAKRAHGVV